MYPSLSDVFYLPRYVIRVICVGLLHLEGETLIVELFYPHFLVEHGDIEDDGDSRLPAHLLNADPHILLLPVLKQLVFEGFE